MFPDDDHAKRRGAGRVARASAASGGEQPRSAVVVVAVGAGQQRGTLYDSFELNAMAVRLNRLLNGDGAAAGSRSGEARRRPRKAAGSWLAAPKVLFRRIKGALLGGRREDG